MSSTAKVWKPAGGNELRIESGGKITNAGTQATAIADLTAATGTADNTIADVGASFDQTTLNNNFKDLATKVNALLAAVRGIGAVASS